MRFWPLGRMLWHFRPERKQQRLLWRAESRCNNFSRHMRNPASPSRAVKSSPCRQIAVKWFDHTLRLDAAKGRLIIGLPDDCGTGEREGSEPESQRLDCGGQGAGMGRRGL